MIILRFNVWAELLERDLRQSFLRGDFSQGTPGNELQSLEQFDWPAFTSVVKEGFMRMLERQGKAKERFESMGNMLLVLPCFLLAVRKWVEERKGRPAAGDKLRDEAGRRPCEGALSYLAPEDTSLTQESDVFIFYLIFRARCLRALLGLLTTEATRQQKPMDAKRVDFEDELQHVIQQLLEAPTREDKAFTELAAHFLNMIRRFLTFGFEHSWSGG